MNSNSRFTMLVLTCCASLPLAVAACGGSGGSAATADQGAVEADVALEGGKPVGGKRRIEVKSGERVVIRVTADAPDEIHVHGYDLEQEVAPDEPAEFDFAADLEGIFEIESHETETVVAELVVEP